MEFTRLEPTGVNTSAEFAFANVAVGNVLTDHLLYANGVPWNFGSGGSGSPGGSDGQIQYNSSGTFAGIANLTFSESTKTLTVDKIVANGAGLTNLVGSNVTGQVANALVAGTVYSNAQPNITSVGILSNLSVTGNVTATYFVGNGSQLTGLSSSYSNTDVAAYLESYTGNLSANTVNVATITAVNANLGNLATANYFSGNGSLFTAIAGANVTGTVANATYATSAGSATTAETVTTNAQPNITSVGTLANLNVTGNVTATYFIGDGSQLTGISGGGGSSTSISNGTSNISIPTLDGNVNTSVGGNANVFVVTSTGANVNGNISLTGRLTTGGGTGGTFSGANLVSANFFSGNGYLLTGITASSATTAETVTTNAQPNITSVGTLTSLDVTANVSSGNANLGNLVTANYFTGNGSLMTSLTGANVTGTVANATYAVSAGAVTTNAQPNITSIGTLTSLTSGLITATSGGVKVGNIQDPSGTNTISLLSGNVTMIGNLQVGTSGAGNVTATYFIGSGASLTSLPAANITGQVANALVAGTVYTNDQPNITSVGILSNLSVSGTTNLGAVSNVTITGGTVGQVLTTNGSNVLSWTTVSGGGGGSSTEVVNGTSNVSIPTLDGNINASVGGNANVVVVTSTGANVNGYLTIGGNANVTGNVTAAYFVGDGSLLTGISGGGGGGSSISNGTSNVAIATTNGNVAVSVAGTSNVAVFSNTGGNITGNLSISGTISAGTGTGGGITGANSITANYFFGNNLTVTGNTVLQQTQEAFQAKTGATGSITHDFSTGGTFWHTSVAGDFTAAVTNLPTTAGRVSILSVIIVQDATPYICNAITINGGSSLTINWSGGTAPTGTASKTDAMVFSIFNNSGTYTVLGQLSSYG